MDNFKKLIQEKNSAIKEYGDFIKTLKNKECDKDVSGLIGLLKDRLAKFENLSCDNYSQTAADIDELNDRIYRQVNLLANLDKISRDSDVYKKYNEVYNQKRIKLFVSEQICRVKKYYQFLIALLGLIPFIIYFIFWQNVGFFSVVGSDSIFSLLSALAISGFGLFVILYIFPALHLVLIVSYDGGEKNETPFYAIYLIATLAGIAFVGVGYFCPSAVDFLNSYFLLIIAAIVIFCLLCSFKNSKFDIPLSFFMISHGFLSFATPFMVALLVYVRVSEDGFTTAFLMLFMAFFAVLFSALITSKDIDDFKIIFWSLIIINLVIVAVMSGKIVQVADLGNINYKMLLLKKDALNALPKSVCQNNQNGCIGAGAKDGCYAKQKAQIVSYNKQKAELIVKDGNETYIFSGVNDEMKFIDANGADIGVAFSDEVVFENSVLTYDKNGTRSGPLKASAVNLYPVCKTYALRQDDAVKLYNVKVLSALGKFYYLQTKSGEKFELDSSLIISKQKASDIR
ncbi:hypothetical protein [uncultured Campylobacter sp.]|uniref:hypothetical protein n=1 Tax=uncultured Campylobacter sp. TaxID=218934 RepID=UPI00261CF504|nr:hypothetical protein [uncultured Campylobacter sp.]